MKTELPPDSVLNLTPLGDWPPDINALVAIVLPVESPHPAPHTQLRLISIDQYLAVQEAIDAYQRLTQATERPSEKKTPKRKPQQKQRRQIH